MNRVLRSLGITAVILAACTDGPGSLAGPEPSRAQSPAASAVVALTAPVFGLATSPDGSLLAAELGGVVEIRKGTSRLVAALSGVSGVAAIGRGSLLAITGEPQDPGSAATARRLFRISQGETREIANLGAYEAAVNPDQFWNSGPPDSNPFGVAELGGGRALVADAGANAVLAVDERGAIDWVAVLTPRVVPTSYFKGLIGCAPGDAAGPCGLPATIPAQPVATSVAVGPDGAYYVGELTGFPGAPGMSRVWRVQAGSRHVTCPSAACTLVADGFTSIVDLAFGHDGTLYVVELDAAGWLGVEIVSGGFPISPVDGGRVQACDVATGQCVVRAAGLPLPAAITVGRDGTVWIADNASIPGGVARVRALP